MPYSLPGRSPRPFCRLVGRPSPSGFSRWAAVVISGDDHAAHVDKSTEAFDNARRDLGRALERRGFSTANVAEFSVEPDRHPDTRPGPARIVDIAAESEAAHKPGADGCLVYLTSHGSPDGTVLGDRLLPPRTLARLIGGTCGKRPTIIVISACFSGVFVPALAGPNRLVLTAARRDRSSFGCGESDRVPVLRRLRAREPARLGRLHRSRRGAPVAASPGARRSSR